MRSTCALRTERGTTVIERAAWRLLNACRRQLSQAELPLPIPVDHWIEYPIGLRFDIRDLSSLGEGVLGAAYAENREVVVCESLLTNPARFRFTCAHELGHLVIHADSSSEFEDTSDSMLASRTKRLEREADTFAAAFLMPRPLVEKSLREFSRQHGGQVRQFGDEDCMEVWDRGIIPHLQERFEVSRAAAIVRCGSLRWRTGAPLLNRAIKDALVGGRRHVDQELF